MEYWDQLNTSGLGGGGEQCEVIAALTFVWLNGDRVIAIEIRPVSFM
jgi:hypothetical protein